MARQVWAEPLGFWELLIELYVDDPHISILGEQDERRRLCMIWFLRWLAFGLLLAFHYQEGPGG